MKLYKKQAQIDDTFNRTRNTQIKKLHFTISLSLRYDPIFLVYLSSAVEKEHLLTISRADTWIFNVSNFSKQFLFFAKVFTNVNNKFLIKLKRFLLFTFCYTAEPFILLIHKNKFNIYMFRLFHLLSRLEYTRGKPNWQKVEIQYLYTVYTLHSQYYIYM